MFFVVRLPVTGRCSLWTLSSDISCHYREHLLCMCCFELKAKDLGKIERIDYDKEVFNGLFMPVV